MPDEPEDQDEGYPRPVSLTPEEFRYILDHGSVIVRCPDCDWRVDSTDPSTQVKVGTTADAFIDHQMATHGKSRQEAMDTNAAVTIVLDDETSDLNLKGSDLFDTEPPEGWEEISGPVNLERILCPECEWSTPLHLVGRDQANSFIHHVKTTHGWSTDQAFHFLARLVSGHMIYRCPRCDVRYKRPEDVAAVSRVDNKTYICSACGSHEAMQQMAGQHLTPISEWPINRPVAPKSTANPIPWEAMRASGRGPIAPAPTPREVPDLRMHLLEKWVPGGPFETALRQTRGDLAAIEAATWERSLLKEASLWWVKAEMVDLVDAGAKSMPLDVHGHEVPRPDGMKGGFAVLAKPWTGIDAVTPGNKVNVHAFAWGYTKLEGFDCLSISFYEYFDFAGGLGPEDLQRSIITGAIFEARSEEVGNGPKDSRSMMMRGGAWVHIGRTDWPLDDTITGFEVEDAFAEEYGTDVWNAEGDLKRTSMIEDRRFFTAFSVIVNNKISEAEMIYSPRATRRRAQREHGIDPAKEPSHVRLIKLREIREHHEPEHELDEDGKPIKRHANYSHRFMVVHTKLAWRACGPGHSQRRLVYIPPFYKGPEDAPLIIKDTVRVWSR